MKRVMFGSVFAMMIVGHFSLAQAPVAGAIIKGNERGEASMRESIRSRQLHTAPVMMATDSLPKSKIVPISKKKRKKMVPAAPKKDS